jgi:hypothetical protein
MPVEALHINRPRSADVEAYVVWAENEYHQLDFAWVRIATVPVTSSRPWTSRPAEILPQVNCGGRDVNLWTQMQSIQNHHTNDYISGNKVLDFPYSALGADTNIFAWTSTMLGLTPAFFGRETIGDAPLPMMKTFSFRVANS